MKKTVKTIHTPNKPLCRHIMMAHVIFKIKEKSARLLKLTVWCQECIYGVLVKKSHQYLHSNIQYYSIYVCVYIYTHAHSDMILASPLQILHPEVLYSMHHFRDSRKRNLCLHSKCIVGVHSNIIWEFHQAVPCVCLQQFTQIVPDPLHTVWILTYRQYINPYTSPAVLHSAPCGPVLSPATQLSSCHVGQQP